MEDLPLDVLRLISYHLKVRDWHSFVLTCKKTYKATQLTREWLRGVPHIPHLRKELLKRSRERLPYHIDGLLCRMQLSADDYVGFPLRHVERLKMSMIIPRCIVCRAQTNAGFITMFKRKFYLCDNHMCHMAFWMSL